MHQIACSTYVAQVLHSPFCCCGATTTGVYRSALIVHMMRMPCAAAGCLVIACACRAWLQHATGNHVAFSSGAAFGIVRLCCHTSAGYEVYTHGADGVVARLTHVALLMACVQRACHAGPRQCCRKIVKIVSPSFADSLYACSWATGLHGAVRRSFI
jgi:hypothetical protein